MVSVADRPAMMVFYSLLVSNPRLQPPDFLSRPRKLIERGISETLGRCDGRGGSRRPRVLLPFLNDVLLASNGQLGKENKGGEDEPKHVILCFGRFAPMATLWENVEVSKIRCKKMYCSFVLMGSRGGTRLYYVGERSRF